MSQKSPRYCLYRDFVDAYMKYHHEMTRCASHHNAQTEWNQLKINEALVKRKTAEYLDKWNKAGRPEPPSKKSPSKKSSTSKKNSQKRTYSSDNDNQNEDPNIVDPVTPTFSKRKASIEIIEIDDDTSANEKGETSVKSGIDKVKAPAQDSILKDLTEISERIDNLIQVKSMGLLTAENQKKLKKLIEQKQQRTTDLKRLQAKQRASTRYRDRKKRHIEKLCAVNPDVAVELSKVLRPTTMRTQIETDCPDLLQIIAEVACFGGARDDNNNKEKACLTLDNLKDAIKERGYEIHKSSLYYRLMHQHSLSPDGKKNVITVPVRLRKMQGIEPPPKHEDSHFTAATLKHIKDLAGIFGNDCVFYLTQDTKGKINIGRPSDKEQSPLIMHLDYEMSSIESLSNPITPRHQLTPCVYAASVIDETGSITHVGPTYISIRSAKHDRLTHESHAIDFDRLIYLKEFEKTARDYLGRIKPIVIMNIDTNGLENHPRYSKTLVSAIDKFKKYNLDALILFNQAPGQALFNIVERRLSPMAHDLAGLILPHNHFGTHLNTNGLTEHVELEKENFKLTGDVLAEVWNMNVLDDYPVLAEYIKPSPMIDEQLQMADSTLALDGIIDRVCAEEEEEVPSGQHADQTRPTPTTSTMEIKTECDIDEYWCAAHVLQTQYTIQIIRCNDTSCCTPWRSNYIRVFPHRFLPPPVPFHRSSRGVKIAEIESSSALTNPISPFYGNLFQRIQFHGIVINRTHNDLLPFDACCPSLQTKLSSRICSICKQYIPTSIRLRNHYKIHQQCSSDFNNKEENIVDDNDLNDPYDISIKSINSMEKGVYVFPDITEWLKSDFEDDPSVEKKAKSTAATASAMIRKDKQIAAETTIPQEKSMNIISNKQQITTINQNFIQEEITTPEIPYLNDSQTENGSVLDALEDLAMIDDGISSIGNPPGQQSWDYIDDLIDAI